MQHKAHCHLRNKVVQCLDEAEISFQGCVRVWDLWICFIIFLLTLEMTNTREKVNWVDVCCKLLQANHTHLLGAIAQCFFIDKYHQWDQSNMLATSKILKEKNRERFVAPDTNILVLPSKAANFMPTKRDLTMQQMHSVQQYLMWQTICTSLYLMTAWCPWEVMTNKRENTASSTH